ncbi:MAG: hypothetical protein ACOVRN_05240 [Flavobacterium sp.]|jgi:hypothetical protein
MKKHLIALTLLCLTLPTLAFAQMNRRVGRQQYQNGPTGKSNQKPKDQAESASEYYAKELGLDSFQEAAVLQIYKDEDNNVKAIIEDLEMTTDIKNEKIYQITERVDARIMKLLTPEQIEKFEKLKAKRKKR